MTIRQLGPDDAEAYLAVRQSALRHEPLSFLSSPTDDRFRALDAATSMLRGETGSVTFGAFAPDLIGIAGLSRMPRAKVSHRVNVWGMYVDPAHRGRGLGTKLMEALIAHARTLQDVTAVHLSVTSAAPAARRVYERLGFTCWGTEPASMKHEGTTVDEHHMVLPLA